MTQSHLSDIIRDLAAPLAAGLGLEIWGIELAFGGRSLVRVYVEKLAAPVQTPEPEEAHAENALVDAARAEDTHAEATHADDAYPEQGVSIKQCAELSRLLSLSLDVEDVVPGAYILEVSSPGLDRVFFTEEQLASAVGRLLDLQFERPLPEQPDRRKFRGELKSAPAQTGAGGLFLLTAHDCPKPGVETDISFAFADLKKARQVWLPPEKPLPGKAAGAKGKKHGQKTKAGGDAPDGQDSAES